MLERLRDVFRDTFGCGPMLDPDPGREVWTSPRTSREVALLVARELVALYARERDPGLEIVIGIMSS